MCVAETDLYLADPTLSGVCVCYFGPTATAGVMDCIQLSLQTSCLPFECTTTGCAVILNIFMGLMQPSLCDAICPKSMTLSVILLLYNSSTNFTEAELTVT